MEKRRRRDEPFNPFAPNAGQKARDRRDNPSRQRPTQRQDSTEKPSQGDLAKKQKAAMEAMKQQREKQQQASQKSEHKPPPRVAPQIKSPPPKQGAKKKNDREDRLAKLRAKSAATAQYAKDAIGSNKSNDEEIGAAIEMVEQKPEVAVENSEIEDKLNDSSGKISAGNVFKTIKTEIKSTDKRPRRRRHDRRGGGRQPQTRKLDRRKYLEYKYVARELLDNDSISEEHRSNVLGQVWAKGERIGVESALEFIIQKEEELILPTEVADEFRKLVKKYTTKR
ncbi:MAG: hypothetical protein QGI21_03080 [Candidatus Poseidoniaceae archaeon]|jgi:hypothetical protein|nr:hypothetical protein [Candidatus Poseidoniaceae archaeon]